jgi:hypothetical protein
VQTIAHENWQKHSPFPLINFVDQQKIQAKLKFVFVGSSGIAKPIAVAASGFAVTGIVDAIISF